MRPRRGHAGSFAREPGKPAAETAGAPECHTSWLHCHVVHPKAKGDVIIVRYADDAVLGFQHRDEVERFLAELRRQTSEAGTVCVSSAGTGRTEGDQ